MDAGELVSTIVLGLIRATRRPAMAGTILDGYPRIVAQAAALDRCLPT
jgi:adenylate kinase family enzyme